MDSTIVLHNVRLSGNRAIGRGLYSGRDDMGQLKLHNGTHYCGYSVPTSGKRWMIHTWAGEGSSRKELKRRTFKTQGGADRALVRHGLRLAAEVRFAHTLSEFPDYAVETLPDIPANWSEGGWHNDISPSFELPSGVRVFVDYPERENREYPDGKRFHVIVDETPESFGLVLCETDDWAEALAVAVAYEFANGLRETLSGDEFAEMRRRNAAETSPSVCHSHDFVDANMVMSDAFESVMGRNILQPDTEMDSTDVDLWNRAWDIAKARYLGESK